MNENKIKQLFKQADDELSNARQELYQPAEDVVTYSVCVFARSALYHYMSCLFILYALDNEETVEGNRTLGQLIEYCNQYDEELQRLNLNTIQCKEKDVLSTDKLFFCNDVFKVNHCTNMACKVRELVVSKARSSLPPEVSFP